MAEHGAFEAEFARKKRWKLDPRLWDAITAILPSPPLRVVDLGAGAGRYVRALADLGYEARGVDGIPGVEQISDGWVFQGDLSQPLVFPKPAQWALSFEVGEHIPAELADHYLDNVAHAATDGILTSWACPGQRGRNHINCQPDNWVAQRYAQRGWQVDEPATVTARSFARRGWDKKLLVLRPQ